MKLFSKKNKTQPAAVQTAPKSFSGVHPFSEIDRCFSLDTAEISLYSALREAVPVIDAALSKIVRLTGEFTILAEDERFQKPLEDFLQSVRVSGSGKGLRSFVSTYLDQLLTYGTAVGEMIPFGDLSGVAALYNASLEDVKVTESTSPLEVIVRRRDAASEMLNQELILSTLLSPVPGTVQGTSVLKGLPFVSSVLLKIMGCIGQNFERAGNIRYAVTYNPHETSGVNARQRAKEIAEEWSRAMRDGSRVCDFVSVGDVSIRVIGADAKPLDYDVPMRRVMEQIVSKLSIPPFLLGLSWSSTERMSTVQADILTSELEYYRSLLTPVIKEICDMHLRLLGARTGVQVEWSNISLLDEVELAEARLKNAQAEQIERDLEAVV